MQNGFFCRNRERFNIIVFFREITDRKSQVWIAGVLNFIYVKKGYLR